MLVTSIFLFPQSFQKANQSFENAGVAFVKGTHERNEFFEKINKHDEQVQTYKQWTNNLRDECQVTKGLCIIALIKRFSDVFNKKRKCCNHLCSHSVYFHMLLLISYLNAIKILSCRRKMSLKSQ